MLCDGARRPKFDLRVAATGSIEEWDAFIGLACCHVGPDMQAILRKIQNDLFDMGADLCRPERSGLKVEPLRVVEAQVEWLEQTLDTGNAALATLTFFVLPGGSEGAALLQMACTVVRRAEREVVELAFCELVTPAVIRYMNRLSDLLFVFARTENGGGGADLLWQPAANR